MNVMIDRSYYSPASPCRYSIIVLQPGSAPLVITPMTQTERLSNLFAELIGLAIPKIAQKSSH